MYRRGISYSQSEKFTVFLGSQVTGYEETRGLQKGTKTEEPDRIVCPDIFFGEGTMDYSFGISGSPSFGGRKRSFAVQIFETAPMLRNVDKTTRHGVIDQRYDTPEEEERKK